jgi:NAD(P)H-hydrate epimerase
MQMRLTELPALSTQQMREVERLLHEEFYISPLQTLENAGRNLALLAKQMLDGDLVDRPVVVLAGRGPNGGGGLAAARHLLNWGAWVQVLTSYPAEEYRDEPAHQLQILQAMDAPLAWAEEGWELPPADLVIDAIIGYGLPGNPRGHAPHLIRLANSSLAPILSLEAPSGFGTERGEVFDPCVRAAATLILALPQHGHLAADARAVCGELYLADIGVPLALYERLQLEVEPIFAKGALIKLS